MTLDPITTGFLQDLQLIVNLAVDKGFFKVCIGIKNAYDFAAQTISKFTLNNLFSQSQSKSIRSQ